MAKCILMSIKPKYVSMILNKVKTIEVRKRFPSDYVGWVYIYCTKDRKQCLVRNNINKTYHLDTCYWDEFESNLNGKVVARFWCDKVEHIEYETCSRDISGWWKDNGYMFNHKDACLTYKEMFDYIGSGDGYAIHITNLEIFDKPKEISEFYLAFSYKGEKPFINAQTNSLVHRVEINGKIEYESVSHLTRAPQSWCYIEI